MLILFAVMSPRVLYWVHYFFKFYINDLHFAIKYCKVHQFADDTNLLNFNNFIKKINKQVGHDLKYLSYWVNANKICLNVSKTEVVLLKSIRKQTEAI